MTARRRQTAVKFDLTLPVRPFSSETMSIRVQCGQCGSVMNVRDEYAGTERRCPKCQGKFQVPAAAVATVGSGSKESTTAAEDDFDPVAFLTGKSPPPGSAGRPKTPPSTSGEKPPKSGTVAPAPEFDPLDVLGGGPSGSSAKSPPKKPVAPDQPRKAEAEPAGQASSPGADDFDPMSVLGETKAAPKAPPPETPPAAAAPSPPTPAGTPPRPNRPSWAKPLPPEEPPAASAPPAEPERPAPKRPSWAKPLPPEEPPAGTSGDPAAPAEPERPVPKRPSWAKAPPPEEPAPDWEDNPAASTEPERPKPKRPSWAKPLPEEAAESPGGGEAAPTDPIPPRPKRPSWAKPLPDEQPAAGAVAGEVAADASPAARAAAAAMAESVAGLSAENPALQEKVRGPWVDWRALAAGVWARRRLMGVTALAAGLLFAVSWSIVGPRRVTFQVIGANEKLTTVPVHGAVTMNGQPLVGARVVFEPLGRSFRSPEGQTDGDGRYRLQLWQGHWGAPPGRYRVRVESLGPQGRDVIPAEFGHFSQQRREVPARGGPIDVVIDTRSPKP